MRAVICDTHDAFEAAGNGAIFLWRYASKKAEGGNNGHVMMKCPGCGAASGMHVRDEGVPHPPTGASWIISGLQDKATLDPSVNCVGCCGWHGFLKNGEYTK
jgi:hypothetical protein